MVIRFPDKEAVRQWFRRKRAELDAAPERPMNPDPFLAICLADEHKGRMATHANAHLMRTFRVIHHWDEPEFGF